MSWGEVGFGFGGIGAGVGVELCLLEGGEALNLIKARALQLAFLVGLSGRAVALEIGTSEHIVGTGLGFGLLDDLVFADGLFIKVNESDFLALEPASLCFDDSFNAANGKLTSPEAMLGKSNERGPDSLGLDEGENVRLRSSLCKSFAHARKKLADLVLSVSARKDILSFAVEETNYWKIPRRFVVFF